MSLYSAIRMASNTLRADQIAMQVVGQNIANANTPGYIREETVFVPAPTQRLGPLLLGLGVQVKAVVQKIDNFLEERLRGAVSEKAGTEAQENTFTQLEQIIGELTDTDLSTAMTTFFNSISEILNQPESISTRNLAMLNGATLTQETRRLAKRVTNVRADANGRIESMGNEINRLIEEIRVLNVRIAETEGGSVSASDAVGLRDQRLQALENLAKVVEIRVREQPSGSVTVYVGGDWLVTEGYSRPVKIEVSSDRGMATASIRIADNDALLEPSAGELHGLLAARDDVLGSFLDQLDDFAATLAFEFNKIYTSGQGLHGYDELTSESYVTDADAPLNQADLWHEPTNGSFKVLVYDTEAKLTHTTDVFVNLTGVSPDQQTTLGGLAAALNQIDGLSATIGVDGKLTLRSTSPINQFAFADDTSGLLAALGINVFFTGSTARDIAVSRLVAEDPAKFAASRGGIGADTDNAIAMSEFLDRPIDSHNGSSISVIYDRMVGETTQGSTVTKAAAEGARVFEQTLRGQKLAISGVSIDEEAIQMIVLQKSFQATARYIGVIIEMLDMLVKL